MQRALLSPSIRPTMFSTLTCNTRLPHLGHRPRLVMSGSPFAVIGCIAAARPACAAAPAYRAPGPRAIAALDPRGSGRDRVGAVGNGSGDRVAKHLAGQRLAQQDVHAGGADLRFLVADRARSDRDERQEVPAGTQQARELQAVDAG